MLLINGQSIYLTRGDNAEISVTAKTLIGTTEEDYEFQEGDRVIFRIGLKPGQDVALAKECVVDLEENVAVLYLEPDDTWGLQFKVYRYEFELVTAGDEHYTFIVDQPFEVGKEIEKRE